MPIKDFYAFQQFSIVKLIYKFFFFFLHFYDTSINMKSVYKTRTIKRKEKIRKIFNKIKHKFGRHIFLNWDTNWTNSFVFFSVILWMESQEEVCSERMQKTVSDLQLWPPRFPFPWTYENVDFPWRFFSVSLNNSMKYFGKLKQIFKFLGIKEVFRSKFSIENSLCQSLF